MSNVKPPMDAIRVRQVHQREYRDTTGFLERLRDVEIAMSSRQVDPLIQRLRTRNLREWREARLAALFCHGYGLRMGHKTYLSKGEFEDADCVARWTVGDETHFAPIQVKEVAPDDLNPRANIGDVLKSLSRYSGVEDLTVLVHLNRREHFNLSEVEIPTGLKIASLWVLACTEPNQSTWAIWGDLLDRPTRSDFAYPA